VTSRARTLLGKGRRRISRTFSTDEERGVTAEHWGEDAREKAESEDWQGLYWQSYVLTAQHINRDISGDPAIDWLTFTKQRFFPKAAEVALSLGCGYGVLDRKVVQLGIAERFEAFDIAPEVVEVAQREAESQGLGARIGYAAADLNTIELETGRYGPCSRSRRCITSRRWSTSSTRFAPHSRGRSVRDEPVRGPVPLPVPR
jgi:SAM-dependent methyltransferase